jgi:deoxyribonuclease V
MAARLAFTHPWKVSRVEAGRIQGRLRQRVLVCPFHRDARNVAGVDVGVEGDRSRAAVVLLSYPDLAISEVVTAEMEVPFPYVPGLLAFREGPVVLAALERLVEWPDVLMFDAQGMAHPRRVGLAAHLGVLLDTPAVGCAKSRLCGTYVEPGEEKGNWTPLVDGKEVIGAVLRTRSRVRPVFVSVGHRVNLEAAITLVLGCCTGYRLPEPIRWAHRAAGGGQVPAWQ